MKKIVWYSLKPGNVILNLAILVGVWLFGNAIWMIVTVGSDQGDVFPLGTLTCIMGMAFATLFSNWQMELMSFITTISMGGTRRRFFISYALQSFLMSEISWILIFVLYRLERFKLYSMYPDDSALLWFDKLFHPATFLLVPLVLMSIGLLIGGMGLKLGQNSRWVLLLIWIALCRGLVRIEDGKWMIQLVGLPMYAYGLIAAGFSIALTLISALLMRKQRVDV